MTNTKDVLLQMMLSVAVPLRIEELKETGGPHWGDYMWARVFSLELVARGDALMYGGRGGGGVQGEGRGSAARLFNYLAKGMAVLAFCPGGITFMGDHWEAQMARVKDPEPRTPEEIARYLFDHCRNREELIQQVAAAIQHSFDIDDDLWQQQKLYSSAGEGEKFAEWRRVKEENELLRMEIAALRKTQGQAR